MLPGFSSESWAAESHSSTEPRDVLSESNRSGQFRSLVRSLISAPMTPLPMSHLQQSGLPHSSNGSMMNVNQLLQNLSEIADSFHAQRADRQQRRTLDPDDFRQLKEAGYTLVGVPAKRGGLWEDVHTSVRPISSALRTLGRADSSVALVSAMHPAVLSYWLTIPQSAVVDNQQFHEQTNEIFSGVLDGAWWGTVTSEPGSGGDVAKTQTKAARTNGDLSYSITGQKHFGSGSGIMDYMVTTAVPDSEESPDWFYIQTREVPWDGSAGISLLGEWDGHGMVATQSHSFGLSDYPAKRIAWTGQLSSVSRRAGGFIGCLFSSVIVGIIDAAMESAECRLGKATGAFEQVEWAHARTEAWLLQQAYEGMLKAVETELDPRLHVLYGKASISQLAETILTRLCRAMGGGTFSRRSPFGFWFEDVRALGFLRPPWNLQTQQIIDGFPEA